jgi:hypothetical protein
LRWSCPSCGAALSDDLHCVSCSRRYPRVGGIPVLAADADAAIQRWRIRTREFVAGVEAGIKAAQIELSRPDLLQATRDRIERSCEALANNRARLLAILSDAGIEPAADDEGELHSEAHGSALGRGGITAFYEQIHRDWGWPADHVENTEALARVVEAMTVREPRAVVVLGAGAGRLAYDLHRAAAAQCTVALDINPLLSIIASRVARGETVALYEFPLIPRDLASTQVERNLAAPHGGVEGFLPVIADAFAAPLPDGCADVVLTPWFIDQVPADARDAIGVVHRLLADGGEWINFGPLIYPKERSFGVRYTATELLELVSLGGFEMEHMRSDMAEFLRSPAAGFARIEQVHTFRARKREGSGDEASWLLAPHLPVPRFDGLDDYVPTHPLLGHVAQMIDGRASLQTIERRVIREHGIPPAVAKLGVPAAAAAIAKACAGGGS